MSGIVLPNGKPAAPSAPSLTEEQKAAIAALAEKVPEEETYPHVRTAFAVIVGLDGQVDIDPSLVKNVRVDREPNNDDVIGAAEVIKSKIILSATALQTVGLIQQQAMAQQQAMQNAMLQRQVQQGLKSGR